MPWRIEVNTELGIIETIYQGVITKQDSIDATTKTLSLVGSDGPHLFLTDFRDADSMLSAHEIFAIPGEWEDAEADRKDKLAFVISEDEKTKKDAQFYEDVCNNRGWNVKVFTNRKHAINWLTTPGPSNQAKDHDKE